MSPSEHYADLLADVPELRLKRMFGGLGVYSGPVFFALIDDDILYFKTDDMTRTAYQDMGSEPFSFPARDKNGVMRPVVISSYWRVPDAILDDPANLNAWAMRAIAVAKIKTSRKASSGKSPSVNTFSGLGRTSQTWLAEIGIHTLADLDAYGAIAAYKTLKTRYSKRVSLNLLWGLYAINNRLALNAIDEETKSHLKSIL